VRAMAQGFAMTEGEVKVKAHTVEKGVWDTMSELTHAQAVGLLKPALEDKESTAKAAKDYKAVQKPIRDYLEAHRDEQLYDGENNIKAFLETRRGSVEMDCMNLAGDSPSLALWAMQHGLLKLDGKQYEAMQGKAGEMIDLGRYVSPGAGSEALKIERVK